MTYNTPELLMVGSAQNLVLTGIQPSDFDRCLKSDEPQGSDLIENW